MMKPEDELMEQNESDMDDDMMESEDAQSSIGTTSSDDDDDDDDDYDSSDITDDEYERRKAACTSQLNLLESHFTILKEHLYEARMKQADEKLDEIRAETSVEYLNQIQQLETEVKEREQVADILKELKLKNLRHVVAAEKQAAEQNYESEKTMLYDVLHEGLEEEIRRLEEDRNNADVHTDIFYSSQPQSKKKRLRQSTATDAFIGGFSGSPEKRRKPITVTGPYIVYMLHDEEVMDDWTTIKKAIKQAEKVERKKRDTPAVPTPDPPSADDYPFTARYDDDKLFYEGDWYSRGHRIIIEQHSAAEGPVHASITAINAGEVWIKRVDGTKSKLYINQLQKGKYSIRHRPAV